MSAHEALGDVALLRGDLDTVRQHCGEARELAISADDDLTALMATCDLGLIAAYRRDETIAATYEERARALASRVRSPTFLGWAEYLAGERRAELDPPGAVPHLTTRSPSLSRPTSASSQGSPSLEDLVTAPEISSDEVALMFARLAGLSPTPGRKRRSERRGVKDHSR